MFSVIWKICKLLSHSILLPNLGRQIATALIPCWLFKEVFICVEWKSNLLSFLAHWELFTAAFSLVLLFKGTCLRSVLYTKQFTLSIHLFIGSPIRWLIYHLYLLNKCGCLQAWNTLGVRMVCFKWCEYLTMFITFRTN